MSYDGNKKVTLGQVKTLAQKTDNGKQDKVVGISVNYDAATKTLTVKEAK